MKAKSSSARSIADVAQGTILARIDIAVPPERVFRALTSEELSKWWGSADQYRVTAFQIELRPGGAWRSDGVGADGTPFHVGGKVLELDPPRKLVQTWEPSWEADAPPTTVAYPSGRASMKPSAPATRAAAAIAAGVASGRP